MSRMACEVVLNSPIYMFCFTTSKGLLIAMKVSSAIEEDKMCWILRFQVGVRLGGESDLPLEEDFGCFIDCEKHAVAWEGDSHYAQQSTVLTDMAGLGDVVDFSGARLTQTGAPTWILLLKVSRGKRLKSSTRPASPPAVRLTVSAPTLTQEVLASVRRGGRFIIH